MLFWHRRCGLGVPLAVLCYALTFPTVQAAAEPTTTTADQAAIEQLAAKMPAGAQKILKESADPPAAPLRLLSFKGGDSEGGPKGDSSYGVDPLEISYEKLEIPRSHGGDTESSISAASRGADSNAGDVQASVSVKAIHEHIGDTVANSGPIDEGATPIVKPPGVHVLDVVARQMKALGETDDGAASPNATISRSLSRLEALKANLPDGGATYAVPTQEILSKLKNLNVDPSTPDVDSNGATKSASADAPNVAKPNVPDTNKPNLPDTDASTPDDIRSKVAAASGSVPDTTSPSVPATNRPDLPDTNVATPEDIRSKVATATGSVPDSASPNVAAATGDIPDGQIPGAPNTDPGSTVVNVEDKTAAVNDQTANLPDSNTGLPDWQSEENSPDTPATDTYGIINLDGKTTNPAIAGFDDFDIPTTQDGLPTIDFDALNQKIDEIKQKIAEQVSVDGIKNRVDTAVDPQLGNLKSTINDKLAGVGSNLGGKTADVTSKVDADLGQMADQVSQAVGEAYDAMQVQLQKQAVDQYQKGNAVDIPAKQCNWPGSVAGGCPTGEKSSSKSARDAAYAERDSYYKTGDQFTQAAAQMPADKANAQASVYEKFGAATTTMNDSMTSAVSSVSDVGEGDDDNGDGDEDDDSSDWDNARGPKYGARSRLGDRSSIDALIKLNGLADNMAVNGAINAAIGNDSTATQYISVIDGDTGEVDVERATFIGSDNLAINVAVGDDTRALQIMDSIYDRGQSGEYGDITFISGNTGAINVVLAAGGEAEMLVSTLMGSVKGSSRVVSLVEAPINVALGANTSATSHLGAWQGVVEGTGNLTIQSTAALSAAIGDSTNAHVRLASQGQGGHSSSLDITVISEGALTAPLGYETSATVAAGNVDGTTGAANVHITTGPVIAASLGSRSQTTNLIGSLSEGASVGGSYNNTVTAGTVIAFALGDNTHATNVIGSVQGRVGGSANINVAAGDILTGTLGERTEAETYIGSILGDVSGNADINVIVGSINTFAVGLSTGSDIYAKTYIGNVTSNQGGVSINASTGAVVNLGVGLIIDLGVLGELKFVHQGCVKIANRGNAPC